MTGVEGGGWESEGEGGIVAISRPARNNAGGRQDAAPGSGEYAFWITGGCPWGLSRCVCRSVRFSSLRDLGERNFRLRLTRHSVCARAIKARAI